MERSACAAWGRVLDAARAVADEGTFDVARDAIGYRDINGLFER